MKSKKKTTQDRLDETICDMAVALYDIDAIDTVTMREFDMAKLPEVTDFTPMDIKKLRLKAKISQAVFANLLNTTVHTIRDWEQGKKHPRGTTLKLLNLVEQKGLGILF